MADRLITVTCEYDVDSAFASQGERGWEVVVFKDGSRCSATAADPKDAFEEACRRLGVAAPEPPPRRRTIRELIKDIVG